MAYSDEYVLSFPGFVADSIGDFVEILAFEPIEFSGTRVTLEVDDRSVDAAAIAKLQQMQEAGGIPNEALLSQVLNPPHAVTSAAERKREAQIEYDMGLLEMFQTSDSTVTTKSDKGNPAKIVKAIKFAELQPAAIPKLEALTELPKSSRDQPPGGDHQKSQTPSADADEIGSLLVATANKEVRFVLAAAGIMWTSRLCGVETKKASKWGFSRLATPHNYRVSKEPKWASLGSSVTGFHLGCWTLVRIVSSQSHIRSQRPAGVTFKKPMESPGADSAGSSARSSRPDTAAADRLDGSSDFVWARRFFVAPWNAMRGPRLQGARKARVNLPIIMWSLAPRKVHKTGLFSRELHIIWMST